MIFRVNSEQQSNDEFAQMMVQYRWMTCGIGKSGLVAHLAAETLTSHGLRTVYVSYEELINGSMNLLDDFKVLFFSKSGNAGHVAGAKPFFVTYNENINDGIILARKAEMTSIKDCPTRSVLDMLQATYLLADRIALWKGWTNEDFLKGHPGGGLSHKHLALLAHREVPAA